jgi:hypothetical protein
MHFDAEVLYLIETGGDGEEGSVHGDGGDCLVIMGSPKVPSGSFGAT